MLSGGLCMRPQGARTLAHSPPPAPPLFSGGAEVGLARPELLAVESPLDSEADSDGADSDDLLLAWFHQVSPIVRGSAGMWGIDSNSIINKLAACDNLLKDWNLNTLNLSIDPPDQVRL